MLMKSFLNENDRLLLLNIAKQQKYNQSAYGTNVARCTLDKINNEHLDYVVELVSLKFKELFGKYIYRKNESCFVRIKNNGWVSEHTDHALFKAQTINTNILLQKPASGGDIIHGNKKVIMNEGDVYFLDTDIPHGITSLKSNDEYYSLLIWHSL